MTIQVIAPDANSTAANRSGRLTEEQQRRIAAAIRAETSPGLVGAGSAAALFLIFILATFNSPDRGLGGYLVFGGLLALCLLLMAALFGRRARLLAEVRAGALERASGHVEFKAGRYRATVPGRSLDLTAFNLGAGTYAFSYLPRSGRVVSAELAVADTPAQAADELRHALAVTNHFNLDDLPAYRLGQQGPGAWRRLRRLWSTAGWLMSGTLVALLVFVYLVAADDNNALAPFAIMIAMLLFIWGLFSVLGDIRPTLDVLGGKVLSSLGEVHKTQHVTYGRYATTYYYYELNGLKWLVSPDAWRALIDGQRYHIYYLPRTKKLVGIEPA